jgi:hypothetical protein
MADPKPKVFKMGGEWMWTCNHTAPVGDQFSPADYRDPWCAATAGALKHASLWHNPDEGEEP